MKTLPKPPQWLPAAAQRLLTKAGEKLALAISDQGPRSVAARAGLFAFVMRVASAVIAFGAQVVLARMMGAQEFGIYAIVWVWVLVITAFASFGYPIGLLRFIPELQASNQLAQLRTVMVRGPLLYFALGTAASALTVAILLTAPPWFDNAFVLPMILAAICLPMMTLMDNQQGISQAFGWTGMVVVPTYIIRPLLILLVFLCMTLAGMEASATSAMIAALVSVWAVGLVQLLVLYRRVVAKIGTGPQEGSILPWTRAALPMVLVGGIYFLVMSTDVLVAGLFVPPDQVAVYYAAAKTLALLHFVSYAVRIATYHKIAEYHATGDRAGLESMLADCLRWTFWPSLVIAILLAVEGRIILSLFGDGFENGMTYLAILLIGVVVRASVGPAEAMLTMANRQSTAAKIYGVVLVVNLALNFTLIPTIGLVGAAVATALAMSVEAALLVARVRKHIGVISFIGFARRVSARGKKPGTDLAGVEPAE